MQIVNLSKRPTDELIRLVNFGVDSIVGAREVIRAIVICDLSNEHGMCVHGVDRHVILIASERGRTYPMTYKYPGYKSAPTYTMDSWQEHIVATVAHEATHAIEFAASRKTSELRAERSAVAVLREWRLRVG